MDATIHDVRLDDIIIGDLNVRRQGAERDIEALATSIERLGLLQPVLLRGLAESDPPWELIVGQRRYLAYRELGRETIPAGPGSTAGPWPRAGRSRTPRSRRASP